MRARLSFVALTLVFATTLFAKDVYLSIGGSVGNFRTDARIFNPSFDKTITITARYLPAGNNDNSAVAPVTATIAPRTMAIYNDVVQSLFGGGPALGAVRLTSDDDFVATQRIFADESANPQNGTLGQFVPGLELPSALKKGVLIQLRQNGGKGQKGTFRTNWGGVNPNAAAANVTLKIYDKQNAVVGTTTMIIKPFGVLGPANIGALSTTAGADLSEAWIGFDSDQPLFLYGSILDNGSEDPTFIPASSDTGVAPQGPPPAPEMKVVTITARNWSFDVQTSAPLKAGEQVKFIIKSVQDRHGFHLSGPAGQNLIDVQLDSGSAPIERIVTLPAQGAYSFFCTLSTCGAGHFNMNGEFEVGQSSTPGTGTRY